MERKLMFPGTVFLECENQEVLAEEFGDFGDLKGQKNYLRRMSQREEEFLKKLCGEKHHLGMSRGVIHKGKTQITEGPLKGMENSICRVDRHKRLAKIEFEGKTSEYSYISVGLEITQKTV